MKDNEGKLQTGEHILARLIQNLINDAKVIITRFYEDYGEVDFFSKEDLREIKIEEIEKKVNEIVNKNLKVNIFLLKREEAEKEFDLRKIPEFLKEIRIVEIEGFDKRPCKDPHVKNTKDIGYFKIIKIERVGKDKYRFKFEISENKRF